MNLKGNYYSFSTVIIIIICLMLPRKPITTAHDILPLYFALHVHVQSLVTEQIIMQPGCTTIHMHCLLHRKQRSITFSILTMPQQQNHCETNQQINDTLE